MAASAPLRSLEEEVTCSICLDYLRDPVTIDCGHVFCRSCTGDIRPISGSRPVCPLCKKPFKKENIRPVWQLASLVENIERLKGELAREPQDMKLCERHQEKLHYYCEDDGKLLCVMCRESREHRPHTAILVEKAALPHRVSPQEDAAGRPRPERRAVLSGVPLLHPFPYPQAQVHLEKLKILEEFKHVRQTLEEEERFLLSRLSWLEQEGVKQIEEYVTKTEEQLTTLNDLTESLKNRLQAPSMELLELRSTYLHRSREFEFHNPTPVPLNLEKKISEAKARHESITESLKKLTGKM
ncbi:Tripartite motif-containing protein 26 [Lemmus lemmus]